MYHRRSPARPPRPSQTWTLVLAGLATFMTALDTLVVTTALPVLRTDLHASLSGLEWTVNAYNLAFACLLLTGAALGDRFGRRRMFSIGLGAFTVASAASALAPTVQALVISRALQGAGAAIVTPLTLTLISEAFPAEKRGAAIGMWGGIAGLAVAAGPVIGGAVVSGIDWHWIFWLNVPIGLALIPAARTRLTESYGPRPQLDLPGLALALTGALGLTWGLVRANTLGWTSPEVLATMIAGAILAGAFVIWERRTPNPMVPPALFKSRSFSAANGVSFFMYAGLFGAVFLMSQLLQTALGNSPLEAGLRLLPWTFPPMIIAPVAGALAQRYGNRPFMVLGMAMQAVGLAWVAAIAAPGVDYLELGAAFTVAGIGTSLCFPTVAGAIMTGVPLQEAGVASGANSAIRELGGVAGVAILASVFIHNGGYAGPHAFMHGFTPAVWVAVGLSAVGIVAATLTGGRAHAGVAVAAPQPQVASA
ncbi:MAG: DHA2 family efflux MFS transporter permease subunit [Solirubrobacterales bacterium]|nr:DHA2 family efflux MFS transporter permease subunit [Solirubrobacterales bacterium]MBV9365953.1 DHA2 family efflux MFS transporter permease subunit [Solirubrobacterales bacterium]MBV9807421.1 DHA2 family efflux MFS transporter permease subunit [Solirubrobacterales bacterium]